MTTLTRIANKHKTDKGTVAYEAHGYTEEYYKYIPETGDYTLIEIGVWHGDSMRMWEDYNPDLNLFGLEIDPNVTRYLKPDDGFNLFVGDAADPAFIQKVLVFIHKLDFVIDDGSHKFEDILASFKLLYPSLKEGGYYFIEDLHAPQARKDELFVELLKICNENASLPWKFRCNDKLLIIQKP